MGRRGPPPKPQALKMLQGTYRKDRDPDRAGATLPPATAAPPDSRAPPRPPYLRGDARQLWDHLVPQLLALGTLQPQDGGALESYCRMFAHARKLDGIAAAEPMIETPFGAKANPAAVEARKLWPLVLKLARDLGLQRATRSA